MDNNKVKQGSQFIIIILLSFLTASCGVQSKQESKIRNLSFEECYEKNLTDSTLITGWYYISDIDGGFVRQLDKIDEFYTIDPFPIITAEDMATLSVEKNNWNEMYLLIKLGGEGTELWQTATKKAIGRKLALIVNDKLLCAPQVHSEITAGVSALGRTDYSKDEYEKIKRTIENNKIEIQIKRIKEEDKIKTNSEDGSYSPKVNEWVNRN